MTEDELTTRPITGLGRSQLIERLEIAEIRMRRYYNALSRIAGSESDSNERCIAREALINYGA